VRPLSSASHDDGQRLHAALDKKGAPALEEAAVRRWLAEIQTVFGYWDRNRIAAGHVDGQHPRVARESVLFDGLELGF
jgi:hypothetical protein